MSAPTFHTLKACVFLAAVVAASIPLASGGVVNPFSPGSFGTALTECHTYAKISLSVTGGSCSGVAQADCKAQAARLVEVQNIVRTYFQTEACIAGRAAGAAKSVATAISRVWAGALITVTCTGPHAHQKGCGFAIANGDSLAIAWTEAIVLAAAGAVADGKTAFCKSESRALIPVLSNAFARAHTQQCAKTSGPVSVVTFQKAFQDAVATAMGDAFATASARVCGHLSETTCTGEAGSSGPSSSSGSGSVDGGVGAPGGSSTGIIGGVAIAPFDSSCIAMAHCCASQVYPCGCPKCYRGQQVELVGIANNPTGPAKTLRSGKDICFCPPTGR